VESRLEEDERIAAKKREVELAKQRAEEPKKRQDEQRVALQEMAKNLKFRVIIDSERRRKVCRVDQHREV